MKSPHPRVPGHRFLLHCAGPTRLPDDVPRLAHRRGGVGAAMTTITDGATR